MDLLHHGIMYKAGQTAKDGLCSQNEKLTQQINMLWGLQHMLLCRPPKG